MPQQSLKFLGSAGWVTDKAEEELKSKMKVTSVEVKRTPNADSASGTITIVAATREDLKDAIEFLKNDRIYRNHFTEF